VIAALRRLGSVEISTLPGREENSIEFRLPAELTPRTQTSARSAGLPDSAIVVARGSSQKGHTRKTNEKQKL
jgi:hypothetical protein